MLVGIDIGSKYSFMSVLDRQTLKPQAVKTALGETALPSMINFSSTGKISYGEEAKINLLSSVGASFNLFDLLTQKEPFLPLTWQQTTYTKTALIQLFLQLWQQDAEKTLHTPITKCILTFSCLWPETSKALLQKACQNIGLSVVEFIASPLAHLFLHLPPPYPSKQRIITLNIDTPAMEMSHFHLMENQGELIQCELYPHLGKDSWTEQIFTYLLDQITPEHKHLYLSKNTSKQLHLWELAEKILHQLLQKETCTFPLYEENAKKVLSLSQAELLKILEKPLHQTRQLLQQLCQENSALLPPWQLLLIGKDSHAPWIINIVKELNMQIVPTPHAPEDNPSLGLVQKSDVPPFSCTYPLKLKFLAPLSLPALPTTARQTHLMLAIDLSGSMAGEPLIQAQKAMIDFVANLADTLKCLSLLAFSDDILCLLHNSTDFDLALQKIKTLTSLDVGYCNTVHPFQMALHLFQQDSIVDSTKESLKKSAYLNHLVVLTDGVWTYPTVAIEAASQLHQQGIKVTALGFGEADEEFLRKIASTPATANLTTLESLNTSLQAIAHTIKWDSIQSLP